MKCARCGKVLDEGARFCSGCGAPAELPGEEIKEIAVLFADLEGFTAFSRGLAPDELAELTSFCMEALDTSVERFGGTVDKHLGDGLMALFGAPVRHERDAEMAVRAGLDMFGSFGPVNDEIEARTGRRLALRVGISYGPVRLGAVGSGGEYTAMGEVVNLAKKIEEGGQTGACLVDENVYRLTADLFEYEDWPADPSGKIKIARKARDLPPVLRTVEIVNRAEERLALERCLARLRDGRGLSVAVVGPGGIGKTALIASVLSEAHPGELDVIHCEGTAYARNVPFGAWSKAVGALFSPADVNYDELSIIDLRTDDDWWPLVAEVFGVETEYAETFANIDPETKRDIALQLVTKRLRERSLEKPCVLVLENAQWFDSSSLDLARAVVADLADKPVGVIVASRGSDPVGCDELVELGPLSEEDSRRVLLYYAGGLAERPDFLAKALEVAAGNPYILCEIGKAAVRADASPDELRVPSSVRGLIQARLDALGPLAAKLVKRAAVLGQEFEAELLRRVAGFPARDFDEALGKLYSEGILERRQGQLRFASHLDREIALSTVVKRERVTINGEAAEALLAVGAPLSAQRASRVAEHYVAAGNQEKAVEYLKAAGKAAFGSFDTAAARYFLERARSICTDAGLTEKRVEITYELANVLHRVPEYETALELLREDLSSVTDDVTRGDYIVMESKILRPMDRVEEAEKRLEEAVKCFEGAGENLKRARALYNLSNLRAEAGRTEEALPHIEESLAVFEREGDKIMEADCHNLLGFINYSCKRYDTAAAEFEKAYRLFKEKDNLNGIILALNNWGGIRSLLGDYDTALKINNELLRLNRLTADKHNEAISLMNLATNYSNEGNLKAAENCYSRATTIIEESRIEYLRGGNIPNGIIIKINQGYYDEARELVRAFWATKVGEARHQIGDSVRLYELELSLLSDAYVGDGVFRTYAEKREYYEGKGSTDLLMRFYRIFGAAFIRNGMLDEAEEVLGRLAGLEGEVKVSSHERLPGRLLRAELHFAKGELAAAAREASAVLEEARDVSNFLYIAHSGKLLAETLFQAGDRRWTEYAAEAARLFDEIGAAPLAEGLRKKFGV